MSNENSFHNGEENLELQNRNRTGAEESSETSAQEKTGAEAGSETTFDGTPHYSDPADTSSYQVNSEEVAERARRDKYNLASLILGIASFAGNICCLSCLTPFTAILAIIFGTLGRDNKRFQTKGLVGMLLGIAYLALLVLSLLYLIVVFVMMGDELTEIFNQAMNEAMSGVPLS